MTLRSFREGDKRGSNRELKRETERGRKTVSERERDIERERERGRPRVSEREVESICV